MLRDRHGKLWSMWDETGWMRRSAGRGPACFEQGWQHFEFEAALQGRGCDRNWLEGTHERPVFPSPAPALLGWDETIYAYCAAKLGQAEGPYWGNNNELAAICTQANENVLRVMGGWNMCVNLHWQTCAVKGLLHGQGGRELHFSIAPGALDVGLFDRPPNNQCVNGGCSEHYAVSDVYYGEVCVLSHICRNGAVLFSLEVGEPFVCDLDEAAFLGLRELLRG